jgi:hypothetical protein
VARLWDAGERRVHEELGVVGEHRSNTHEDGVGVVPQAVHARLVLGPAEPRALSTWERQAPVEADGGVAEDFHAFRKPRAPKGVAGPLANKG